jgi:hypothetical protein
MANRVLIGEHPSLGHGVFVSKGGDNVLSSDNDSFLFDSTVSAGSSGCIQTLFFKESIFGASVHHNQAQTYTFDSGGVQCFAMTFASTTATSDGDSLDIFVKQQATGVARATAETGLHGGTLGVNDSFVIPTYEVSVTNSGNTGTVSITPFWEGGSGNDICIQVLVLAEGI